MYFGTFSGAELAMVYQPVKNSLLKKKQVIIRSSRELPNQLDEMMPSLFKRKKSLALG